MSDYRVKLIIDSEGNVNGVKEAQSAFASLGDTLARVKEIAMGMGLERLGEEAMSGAKEAFGAVADFQEYTASLGGLLTNLGNAGAGASDQFQQSTGAASHAAQKTADEMRHYTEKMADLQSQLKDVLSGQNIIDENKKVTDQLNQLAEQHASKLISLEQSIQDAQDQTAQNALDRAQSLQDRLDNMGDTKANSDADKAEKLSQDLANARGDIERKSIQKKYDDQKKLDDDSYARKLATAKTEGEKANAEAAARDKAAADKKVATLNAQIAQENKAYDEQKAKIDADRADSLAKLDADNAKKLAKVKQEIDDEEIAHKEALQSIAESGGGGANSMLDALLPTDQFAARAGKLKDELGFLDQFAPKTPFEFKDIVESDRLLTSMGVNGKKIIPVIGDIAASFGQGLGTGTQAVLDGLNGNMRMLQLNFGITSNELAKFNGGMKPKTQEEFLEALVKIRNTKFAGGMVNEMDTFNGRMSNMKDNLFRTEAGLFGINTATGALVKGGVFDTLSTDLLNVSNYLAANKNNIINFFKEFENGAKVVIQWITQAFVQLVMPVLEGVIKGVLPPLIKLWKEHGTTIIQVAEVLGGAFMFAVDGVIVIVGFLIQLITEIISEFMGWIESSEKFVNAAINLGGAVTKNLTQVFTTLGTTITNVFKTAWTDFKEFVNHMIDGINGLINAADKVGSKIPGLSTVKINTIPHLASGTNFFEGGAALVGENGPETVIMPRGAQVIPAGQTAQNKGKNGVVVHQVNHIYNMADAQKAINKLNYNIAIR